MGAPLKQINTRACGQNSQEMPEDPYVKTWKEWVARDSQGRMEKAKKLEKQENLTKSWELVRECRKIIKENYSSWQERKTTEEENKKLQEIELEKLERLEKAKGKQEKIKISTEMQSKEEAMRKCLEKKRRKIQP